MFNKKRPIAMIGILMSLTLLAAACGSDSGSDTSTGGDTPSDGGGASGSIEISGSSTVEPISTRVAELLEDENSDIFVNVDGPGTGDGFALFCEGQTDISNASRAIKDEEVQTCEDNGIDFTELLIAQDGITVMANPDNPLECVNFSDLYAIIGPESSDVNNWSDASTLAAELGSDTEFPDLSLDISAPGAESGTFGSFIEITLEGIYDTRLEAGDVEETDPPIRNYPGQADDNIIIQGIEGSEGAFGYVGFAFAEEAGDSVKELAVSEEPGGECILPTAETIADNSYPISRPLYIYVNNASIADNPAVAEYVDFYLGDAYSAVEEVGYVNLDDSTLADTVSTWEAARG